MSVFGNFPIKNFNLKILNESQRTLFKIGLTREMCIDLRTPRRASDRRQPFSERIFPKFAILSKFLLISTANFLLENF